MKYTMAFVTVFVALLIPVFGWAQVGHSSGGSGRVTVTEPDGSPSMTARTLRFTNGTVTDAGNGIADVDISGTGSVATDTIWDAAGDLVVGSGANTAARLAKGNEGEVLTISGGSVAWGAGSSGMTHPQVMVRASVGF